MSEVNQNLDAFDDDLVGPVALDVGDETDTAGIVFDPRVIEALGAGRPLFTECCCIDLREA